MWKNSNQRTMNGVVLKTEYSTFTLVRRNLLGIWQLNHIKVSLRVEEVIHIYKGYKRYRVCFRLTKDHFEFQLKVCSD